MLVARYFAAGFRGLASSSSSATIRRGGMSRFRPIVVSGPSGGGKSTILNRLFKEYPDAFVFSVSHTTRNPRPGEKHGKEYYFVGRQEMEDAIRNGEFIESAEFGGNLYGTSKKAVRDIQATGKICILDIELQGVRNVKKTDLDPRYIFVKPPNFEALEKRLRARQTENEESLKKRLDHAKKDMQSVEQEPDLFDYVIVNDDLETAYQEFHAAILDDLKHFKKSSSDNQ